MNGVYIQQGFPSGSAVKETQETWVQFLGEEDPLEEEMATDSNIFAWKIPWTEEPGRLQFMGSQKSRPQLNNSRILFHGCVSSFSSLRLLNIYIKF